jgi:hypothetical protein
MFQSLQHQAKDAIIPHIREGIDCSLLDMNIRVIKELNERYSGLSISLPSQCKSSIYP